MPDEPALPPAPKEKRATATVADPDATTAHDAPAAALPASSPTDRYLLGAEIARGGMGAVYRATDTAFGREVAIKVLLDRFAPDSRTAHRFHDEARITGQLEHPGIPPAHDLGALPDGRPFLAMKLIKGKTLHDLLNERSDPSADRGRLVAVFEGVCQAMAYAHAHGVVHRDLKPSNVMVGAFGEVQVMDWGLAKVLGDGRPSLGDDSDANAGGTVVGSSRDSDDQLTQAGSVLGTPAYMPPEQAIGAVHEVDRRSDVFGLGAILAVVLTGQPPFVSDTAETTRVLAARGEMRECFERLEGCGADPGLLALAKRCLATRREDRPADAEAVANEVAALRAAADDRARQAEVELATAAAASAERRKRRQVWLGAAAALTLAVVGGLGSVLAVQRRANTAMAVANGQLAAQNDALEAERAKVEQRFDMARKAIAAFHTTIDEQPELGNEAFRPLRKKLLTAAAGFYRELEGLLAGETDAKSRTAMADGYFQLAELTLTIGDQKQALAEYQKSLSLRRELAARQEADSHLALAVTLRRAGIVMEMTGDTAGARRAIEEARDVASALEAEAPTDSVRQALGASYHTLGWLLEPTGELAEAMAAYQKALAIRQGLADAHPAVTEYQSEVASSHNSLALVLRDMGKLAEAMAANEQALAIRQGLADAHPTVPRYQTELSGSHNNIGNLLKRMDKPAEALAAHQQALAVRQRQADAHPAVTEYQSDLAQSHDNIGNRLREAGKLAEALAAHEQALAIRQRLADSHTSVTQFQSELADTHFNIGAGLDRAGQPAEALVAFEKARDIYQQLADAHPAVPGYQIDLADSQNYLGNLLRQMGKPGDALAAFEEARDVRRMLADTHPAVTSYQSDLAGADNNLGQLLAKEGRFAEAFAALDAGLLIREKLLASETKSIKYSEDLGSSHAYRGCARVRAGQPDGAAADLRKALELWAKNSAPDAEDHFEKSRTLALLAKLGADAGSGVTADETKAFADRAVAALADAIQAGSSDLKELMEPDFDAVRNRDDFRLLMLDLAFSDDPFAR